MELRHLKSFVVVAEEQSIGRAALRLHISQPPLTRQIQQLEEDLGAQLLLRTARGVELTEAGATFLAEARNILALTEQATERTHKAGLGQLGRIDVGIFGSGIFGIIPKMLLAYRQAYPDVNIVMHSMNKGEQVAALRQHRLNVGFNRLLQDAPDIESELILMEDLYLAVNRNHPLSRERQVAWRDLTGHPLVLFPSGTRPSFIDRVFDFCREEGFQPTVVQEVGDAVHGVALVASGFGLCIVPESAINLKLPGVIYRPLKRQPPAQVDLSCIYRRGDQSTILRSFLEIARTFRNLPD
jgi:DNA-binding transcriptional LysR family regulator